jgi:DNA-binding XRE family transcriptional regulator
MGKYQIGQPRDAGRFRYMVAMRAAGCTLAEIGRRLGVSRQAVHDQLNYWSARRSARCRVCAREFASAVASQRYDRRAYCLDCLAHHPEATFAERLLALRLSAGLTIQELGGRAGVCEVQIWNYEHGRGRIRSGIVAKLARVLPELEKLADVVG